MSQQAVEMIYTAIKNFFSTLTGDAEESFFLCKCLRSEEMIDKLIGALEVKQKKANKTKTNKTNKTKKSIKQPKNKSKKK